MSFKRAKQDNRFSKQLRNGNTRHFFHDGMCFAYLDVDANGNYAYGTFIEDSEPTQQMLEIIKKG